MLKRIKISKRNGGGGGGGKVESIPDWARPYFESVGAEAERVYGSGQLGRVAGVNAPLGAAISGGSQAIAQVADRGMSTLSGQANRLTTAATTGGYDTSALKDAAVLEAEQRTADLGREYGASGTLGSARQMVRQGASDAATKAAFASIDRDAAQQEFQNKMAAEQALGANVGAQGGLASGASQALLGLGQAGRQIEQERIDAPWQALQRFASTIYGNPARQSPGQGGGK